MMKYVKTMAFPLAWILAWMGVAVLCLALLLGCESRTFRAVKPDGTSVQYTRMTVFGDSSTEGVSVSKDGEDYSVDVGPTNSNADTAAFNGLILDLAKKGAGL